MKLTGTAILVRNEGLQAAPAAYPCCSATETERMTDWPDAKIRSTALWYIGKHTMDPPTWRYTLVGDAHPDVLSRAELESGELPLVSFLISEASWYVFTTRRVVGEYSGRHVKLAALDVLEDRFGNFKGYRGAELEVMTLRLAGGEEAELQYETGRASMAPIYYFRYWKIKYPILDKLKAEPLYGLPRQEGAPRTGQESLRQKSNSLKA